MVVLPFDNFSGDSLSGATVESITGDVTLELTREPILLVAARNAALAYKAKPLDLKRVGHELGVRYAVEGSARRTEGVIRINAELVSTDTNQHIWAARFDASPAEIDITMRQIATALRIQMIEAEYERSLRERSEKPDSTDFVLRGMHHLHNLPPSPQNRAEAASLYERAVQLDPSSLDALTGLAEALLEVLSSGPADAPNATATFHRAEQLLQRAAELDPEDRMLAFTRVFLLGSQFRCAELIPIAEHAVEAHPSLTGTRQWLGKCMVLEGRPAEAIPYLEAAIRTAPWNRQNSTRYIVIARALLYLGRYEDALAWFHRTLAGNPNWSPQAFGSIYASIAAAHAFMGHLDEARASAAEASRVWPALTIRNYCVTRATNPEYLAQLARIAQGLRLAGVRDHADEKADDGVQDDAILHTDYEARTPISVPGGRTIKTPELARFLEQERPLVLDTRSWGKSIPGAIGLSGAGIGGTVSDDYQDRLRQKLQQLTHGNRNEPIVTLGWNTERYEGRNLALRLAALGYTNIYWYRGGREAWEVAGLPETEVAAQEW